MDALARHHDEVLAALKAIGDPRRGEAIRRDRGSAMPHLGISFPALRSRVKQGFAFSQGPEEQVLRIWDGLWCTSPYGDVLFAAIEALAPIARQRAPLAMWVVARGWSERIDNWCHSDALSGLYSWLLDAHPGEVYPQLQAWNAAPGVWHRRLSLTSLIHYSGKNAVFLAPGQMLPLLAACVEDHRQPVESAVGWVLRELGHAHRAEATAFLERHAPTMSARAFARAIERRTPDERARLAALRPASPRKGSR